MDQFKNWLPISSIGIILFSFLNLHFFYIQFGIVVYHYLDVSEIIFSLTSLLASLILLTILVLWFLFFFNHNRSLTQTTEIKEETKAYRYLKFHKIIYLRKFAGAFSWMTIYVILSTLAIILFVCYLNTNLSEKELLESSIFYDLNGFMFLFVLSGYIVLCSLWFRKKKEMDTLSVYLFLSVCLLNMIIMCGIRNARSADLIKKGFPKYKVSLITERGKKYVTNDTILYIGATRNFYFLYDKYSDESIILPSNSIIEAKVKNIRGGL